jgi:hypothetical protein
MNEKSQSNKGETILRKEREKKHWESQKSDRKPELYIETESNREKQKTVWSSNWLLGVRGQETEATITT